MAGLVKLHKHFKIEKLTMARQADVERAEIRQRARSSDEIPFGAKAMLEDPDIEGVWNSRASTPLQSPVLAPRSSSHSRLSLNPFSKSRQDSSVSSFSHLDLPQRSPSNASVEALSPLPKEPAGASSSTMPAPSINSHDTPWQYQASMPFSQNQPMPRRRSVTIRATPRDASSARTAQGEQGQAYSCEGNANAAQMKLTYCVLRPSRSEDVEYLPTQCLQHLPMKDVDKRWLWVAVQWILQCLKGRQLPEKHWIVWRHIVSFMLRKVVNCSPGHGPPKRRGSDTNTALPTTFSSNLKMLELYHGQSRLGRCSSTSMHRRRFGLRLVLTSCPSEHLSRCIHHPERPPRHLLQLGRTGRKEC